MGKGDRAKSAREKIEQQRAADRVRERRKKLVTYVTAGAVALAAVGAGWWYAASRSQSEQAGEALAPITVQPDGAVVMAKQGVERPVVDVYEDYQCPACRELERVSGPTLKNLAAEGLAKVVFHPITIFSQEPTKSNSVRAGAAARCVTEGAKWMTYHDLLFENQPSEAGEGFKLDDLVAWGEDAGITDPAFAECVTSQKYAQAQLAYSQKIGDEQKIEGTPTIKVNGTAIDNSVAFTPQELRQTITEAAK
ncbi:thioredoxin domain-containing protein [Nonomuraea sp. MCN248]|uniref:Thioredoxin domain-containing protein n=1 Tax=Nonomuraea corallina TaxID=2989783 RepID=A0ABT4SGF2_9ACTN|nr:thioredoxin domain-containing protein [Nonomuraea corallina]MDA0636278.1 thioredoxin domain-containing protein [Nonomuraea corallina]